MLKKYLVLGLVGLAGLARAEDGTGLRISGVVDTVAQGNLSSGNTQPTNMMIRGAEIMVAAPADHLFDGTLSVAAHGNEDVGLELHEAWIGSTKLIPRSRFRLGQFFLGVGRLNQFHQHDWPFIGTPRIHEQLFAFEGVFDTGMDFSYLLPVPFFLELTLGLTNGFVFGHSHNRASARPPKVATHYARIVGYVPMPFEGGSQIGLSYLGNRSNSDIDFKLIGMDLTAKWKNVRFNELFIQSEAWYRTQKTGASAPIDTFGFYVYPEYYLGENFFLGVRLDYFSNLNLKDAFGLDIPNHEWNVVPTVSWKPSEFSTFRLAYNHRPETLPTGNTRVQNYIEFQSVFILGAHPAHDF